MSQQFNVRMVALVCGIGLVQPLAVRAADKPLDIGSRLEMFVDRLLIDRLDNAQLKLCEPRDEGEVLRYDQPWEGKFCAYNTVIHDGTLFRLYYRGTPVVMPDFSRQVTCYAESKDGHHWTKPKLGLHEVGGAKDNNVIFAEPGFTHNFSPFIDTRPGVPPSERFKALGGVHQVEGGLLPFVSGDGIHWSRMRDKPVITKGAFDSQNVPFWSDAEQRYVVFFRIFTGGITTAATWQPTGLRSIARATSPDFIHWSDPEPMRFEPAQEVHLYINQTHPYFRAPHLWVSTAARFMPGRVSLTDAEAKGVEVDPAYFRQAREVSDCVLLTSRDGHTYQQTFRGALIRPGLRLGEWVSRCGYPALNVVQTGPAEMSLYVNQNFAQPTMHMRRYSMRLDGFASVNAPYEGGEMITKPLRFEGKRLVLNFATSAAGGIRVELQDAEGKPIPGYAADECVEIVGNRLEWPVRWKNGDDVGALAGRPVRLRFIMKDADLFALRFAHHTGEETAPAAGK